MEAFSPGAALVVDDVEDQFAMNLEVFVARDVAQTRDRSPGHVGKRSRVSLGRTRTASPVTARLQHSALRH